MKLSSILGKTLVILFWIGIWALAAQAVHMPVLLPSPVSVFARIFELLSLKSFWEITGLTLIRIMAGILTAIVAGILIAVLTHHFKLLRELLAPVLTVVKVTPVASFILLALVWLGRNYVPAVISGLMVLPVVWTNVSTGLRNIDQGLLEMATVYKLSPVTRTKRIVIPSVMPYFLSAAQTSIGIGWKAGIAAEVLTVPVNSIGKMIADSKLYMETLDLFAWTVVVILISLIIEKLLVGAIRRLGQRYNSEVTK